MVSVRECHPTFWPYCFLSVSGSKSWFRLRGREETACPTAGVCQTFY